MSTARKNKDKGEGYVDIDALKVIQNAWAYNFRFKTTARIAEDYLKNGPTIEHVKSISFEQLVVELREKPVIMTMKAIFQRIHLLCIFMHGSPSKYLTPENINVRVILAAYMIAYRPTHVFESMGLLEQSLLESSIPLLETFEKMVRAVVAHKGKKENFFKIVGPLSADFPAMVFEYLKRFKAWKIPDEAKLTCRIKHALLALYQAEDHLPIDEPDDSKLKVEFRTQIERLRSKLQQIAGAEALERFDEQRKSSSFVVREGRLVPVAGAEGEVVARAKAAETRGAYAALPGRMTNEQLAHELLLDPTFQLDEHGGSSIENPVFHRIREAFHQAFWDSLVDDLKLASPCYVRVLRVLAEISEGINDLAGTRESCNIHEAVDLDFIKQQAEQGLFGWGNCIRLIAAIVEVVQRVQAPRRDDETKAKWKQVAKCMDEADVSDQPRAFCKALEFLLDRVNAMRIDAANARLRLIAPVIKDHGVDYERGKLQDKLNDGSLTLERTGECVAAAVRRQVSAKNVELQHLLDGLSSAFLVIHRKAMLELITSQTVPRAENVPETLLFDVHRLSLLQSEFRYLVLASTMMVTVASVLAGRKNATDAQVLGTISEQFVSASRREIDVDRTVADIEKTLERSTIDHAAKDKLCESLKRCASPTDPVHRLMAERMYKLFDDILALGMVPRDVKLVNAAKPLIPRIDKAATKLRNIANLNRNVHISIYNTLIIEAAQALDKTPSLDAAAAKAAAPAAATAAVPAAAPAPAAPAPRPVVAAAPAAAAAMEVEVAKVVDGVNGTAAQGIALARDQHAGSPAAPQSPPANRRSSKGARKGRRVR